MDPLSATALAFAVVAVALLVLIIIRTKFHDDDKKDAKTPYYDNNGKR